MSEITNEEALTNEAKVVAEQPPKVEESTSPVAPEATPVKSEQAPVKKKKNPVVIILLVLFGLAAICCSCAVGGFFALNYTIQNSAQAVTVKELFTALNDSNKEKVKTLSSATLFEDLYQPMEDGTSLADIFKGNIDKVSITSFNVNNNNASVKYTILVKSSTEVFSKVTYAELEKIGESWVVTYFGPETGTTPTPTLFDDGF